MGKVEVTPELVKKVAANARLALTDDEVRHFVPQIKEVILDSFSKLDELQADEEPSFQPVKKTNVFRKDYPSESLSQEDALKNVKEKLRENGYIKGPKVM